MPKAGVIHKPFVKHNGKLSKTYLGTAETGAYETVIHDFMQENWTSSRPIHYLEPFNLLDQRYKAANLHAPGSNDKFNSEYEIKVAAAMIRYKQIEEALHEC